MFLFSKEIISDVAKLSDELSKTPAVKAASKLPGFDKSQDAFKTQRERDRPAPCSAPASTAEGPSGGLFTEKAW